MGYMLAITRAGKTKEIEKYYAPRSYARGEQRLPRKAPTREEQRRVNYRQAVKTLRRLMNANFDNTSLYLTMDYIKEQGRDYATPEEMREDLRRFMRKLRAKYKKRGKELRYISVKAIGQRSARHFHMVLSDPGIDYKAAKAEIQAVWDEIYLEKHERKSFVHLEYLYGDNYGELAAYFVKQSETTIETFGGKIGRRWDSSRNLVRPVTIKKPIENRRAFRKEPSAPKGWYIDKPYTEIGVGGGEYGGFEYIRYILIKQE